MENGHLVIKISHDEESYRKTMNLMNEVSKKLKEIALFLEVVNKIYTEWQSKIEEMKIKDQVNIVGIVQNKRKS